MIKRIAKVSWWVGALFIISAFTLSAYYLTIMVPCKSIFTEEASYTKYAEELSAKTQARLEAKAKKEGREMSLLDSWDSIVLPDQLPRRQGFDQELLACKDVAKTNLFVVSLVLTLFSLPFFILCFILGGSFWTPPKQE